MQSREGQSDSSVTWP
nr:unnamed protein product [Callosobruchus chinensis]